MKTVLITGAAQGIGFSTACLLAQTGYKVYAMVRTSSDTTELEAAIVKFHPHLIKIIGDVTDDQSVTTVVQTIVQQSSQIDIVINNACHVMIGTCETCTIQEQQQSMDVNYFGAVRVLQAALPYMRANCSGQVINISSVAGYEPFPHLESYLAGKYALEGLTESLASHLAPWNIRVSLIQPGGVKTQAPSNAPFGSRKLSDTDCYDNYCQHAKNQMIESYTSSLEPLEIANLILAITNEENPHLRYPVGNFAQTRADARFRDPTGNSHVDYKNDLLQSSSLLDYLGS